LRRAHNEQIFNRHKPVLDAMGDQAAYIGPVGADPGLESASSRAPSAAQAGRTTMTKPVLIVGAGPVGMTIASELARYGVTVRAVDRAAQRTDKSKALVLWSRTLELLDRGGGSAPFVDAGFKAEAVNLIAGDKVIGRVDMGSVQSPYPYALMLPQSETERLKRDSTISAFPSSAR
jgi:hypothetical protein